MYNEVITLLAESKTVDDYGDEVVTTTEKTVFAELRSIGQSEFYQAQAVGLKPEVKFVLPDYLEYAEQKCLKYKPYKGTEEVYEVIRTYRSGNELELVCKRGIE